MYYIFNKEGLCVACCNYEPDLKDLYSRNEQFIEDENIYDISKIKLENGIIVDISPTLDELKVAKLAEIDAWTANKIISGFTSFCSGEEVTYDSDKDTQLTMQGIALNVNSDLFAEKYSTGCPVRGYAQGSDTKQIYMLSPEQVMLWQADLSIHIGTCKQEGWAKQAEVEKAQSKEELDAIILE